MFVPHSEIIDLIEWWAVRIAGLILVISVLIAVVVKDWRLLRGFLKTKDSKPKPKVKREAEK